MRKALRLALALGFVAGYAVVGLADDLRFRHRTNWIPGFFEGRYSGESDLNLLPDVIEATLEWLNGDRTIENLTPVRTLEKL